MGSGPTPVLRQGLGQENGGGNQSTRREPTERPCPSWKSGTVFLFSGTKEKSVIAGFNVGRTNNTLAFELFLEPYQE